MNRVAVDVLVIAGIVVTGCSYSGADHAASGSSSVPAAYHRGTSCAHPTAIAATYKPVREGSPAAPRVGPVTFHPYPYQLGVPTKVLIHQVKTHAGSLSLTGYNCRDGRLLRFWYRGGPNAGLPQSLNRAPNEGDRVTALPSCRLPCPDDTGYMLFTEPGRWNIIVSLGTAVIGNIVITVARR